MTTFRKSFPASPRPWKSYITRSVTTFTTPISRTWVRSGLAAVGMFLIFVTFLAAVQFATPDLPDNDGFYHIRMAALMRTEGLRPAFPWLPLTILNPQEFYDHHLLFHVALIPFTFGDLRLGAKWASVIFASLAFLCIWRLLRGQRLPYATLWSLGLLAISEAFLYRLSITRAQSLSLAVLALGLHLLLTGQNRWLFALACGYVWLYDAFPLLPVLAGIYVAAVWLVERRLDLRPLGFALLGTLLGLLVNPYFPDNLVFAYRHILPKLLGATAISVGNEWYPYTTGQLLKNSPLALAAFLSGGLALGLSGRRMDVRTATSFLATALFGLMLFQSRRFIEYFPAFALIFAAFAWAPLLISAAQEPVLPQKPQPGWRISSPAGLLGILLLLGLGLTLPAARESLRGSKPYSLYAGASAWLKANTPAGARLFQTDWDDFPRLFFYNTHNTYLVGLDPTYLQLADPALYSEWVEITQGKIDQPSAAIRDRFEARWVLTDQEHGAFLHAAAQDPSLEEVYRDSQAVVFRVTKSPDKP